MNELQEVFNLFWLTGIDDAGEIVRLQRSHRQPVLHRYSVDPSNSLALPGFTLPPY